MKRCIILALLLALLPVAVHAEEIASFYADYHHGSRMANGERFSQYDPLTTAANRWPLGTWLRVKHAETGRFIFVQVRDTGGFTHALDLSKAAFAQLENTDRGIMPVEVEVVERPLFAVTSTGGTRMYEEE